MRFLYGATSALTRALCFCKALPFQSTISTNSSWNRDFFSHHCHLILNLSKFNSFFILVAISLILELLSYMGFNPVCCLISSIKLITVCCFMYKLASVFCQKHRAPQKTDHLYNPTGMLTPLSLDR